MTAAISPDLRQLLSSRGLRIYERFHAAKPVQDGDRDTLIAELEDIADTALLAMARAARRLSIPTSRNSDATANPRRRQTRS